ncbi:30695_t:CDS:2, partial [Gigaspora margarita]
IRLEMQLYLKDGIQEDVKSLLERLTKNKAENNKTSKDKASRTAEEEEENIIINRSAINDLNSLLQKKLS